MSDKNLKVMGDEQMLSREACRAVAERVFAMGKGGGKTTVNINSRHDSTLRWGRNEIFSGGNVRESEVWISRRIRGAEGHAYVNSIDDDMLRSSVKRAEDMAYYFAESPDNYPDRPRIPNPHSEPKLWFDSTIAVNDSTRAATAESVIAPAEAAKFLSAGYVQVAERGDAVVDNEGMFRYYPYTTAQYSVTVRSPDGTGSGWAGVDWNDWTRIDTKRLAEIALDKCIRSQNPSAVEPGRYTAILEPQAVCDLLAPLVEHAMDRGMAEYGEGPFAGSGGSSKISEQVIDSRLTLSSDPMDPDCGFVPFDWSGEPHQNVKWIDNGVLRELSYSRDYAIGALGKDLALPNSHAFRLGGGNMTIEEMIANTERGVLVTRLNNVQLIDINSMLCSGTTRDGLWLIEKGKITKAIKNFRFNESPMFMLNSVAGVGAPQRVFRPSAPAVVPPLMVRDFSFTALSDAV